MQKKSELQSQQQELQAKKEAIRTRKDELIALKEAGGKSWSDELQNELDELVTNEVDLDEQIENNAKALFECEDEYDVPKGTEGMVHLLIVRGRRFNPKTGKEESRAYTQIFSVNEFNLFKKNANLLGYSVLKVLHDPTGEANKLLVTK